jgi:hypothetical protein
MSPAEPTGVPFERLCPADLRYATVAADDIEAFHAMTELSISAKIFRDFMRQASHPNVWFARGVNISDWWRKQNL